MRLPPLPTTRQCSSVSRPAVYQCCRAQCGSTEEDIASAHHPAVLARFSSSSAAQGHYIQRRTPWSTRMHGTAVFAILLLPSSSAQVPCGAQWQVHLNEGGSCRRRLCPPPGGARQPLVQQCRPRTLYSTSPTRMDGPEVLAFLSSSSSAQVLPCRAQWRFHLNEGGSCRRRLCPPPGGAHQPLVQQCRPPCTNEGGHSLCSPPGGACQPLVQQCRSARVEADFAMLAILTAPCAITAPLE